MPGIAWAEADRPVVAAAVPDDPSYPRQWTLGPLGVGSNASLDWPPVYPSALGSGVLVAVLDTGFEPGGSDGPEHVRMDLARNFVAGGTDVADDNGHGTFISNIIAEDTGNSIGAAGIAPGASIVPVKVLGADGTGDLSVVAKGIDYAASIGAQVINLSLEGDESPALCAAVQSASQHAVVVGRRGQRRHAHQPARPGLPGRLPGRAVRRQHRLRRHAAVLRQHRMRVGCRRARGRRPGPLRPRRQHSDWVVQQTYDLNPADGAAFETFRYFEEEGTSMSAAQVAGEAALLMGLGATSDQTRRLIVGTARPAGTGGVSETFGAGAVDIARVGQRLPGGDSGRAAHPWVPRGDRGPRCPGPQRTVPAGRGPSWVTGSLSAPIVGMAGHLRRRGLLAGRPPTAGSSPSATPASTAPPARWTLNQPIVGMAATPDGHGYWLVASDGGIFTFGDAGFYGSTGAHARSTSPSSAWPPPPTATATGWSPPTAGSSPSVTPASTARPARMHLNQPIVGMAATPDGHGYWLVASDGGIFTFGDAGFYGSTAGLTLARPIVAMSATSDGRGYLAHGRRRQGVRLRRRTVAGIDQDPRGRSCRRYRARAMARPMSARGFAVRAAIAAVAAMSAVAVIASAPGAAGAAGGSAPGVTVAFSATAGVTVGAWANTARSGTHSARAGLTTRSSTTSTGAPGRARLRPGPS